MATTGVRYVTPSQIAVVRGRVVSLNEGMMVVDCEPDPEAQGGFAVDLGAGAGAAASEAMAKWAITARNEKILREYGPLKMVALNGTIRDANEVPANRPVGRFAICDYPVTVSHVHVVAAETDENFKGLPVYAVKYQLANDPKILCAPSGVFDIYPPGVDTPEKRREFLQAQIEAKKNGTAPVQRTTNRTRGY